MIPSPPPIPPPRRQPLYQEYVPIAPGLAGRIRIESSVIGSISILLALVSAIVVIPTGFLLPTWQTAATIFIVIMAGLSSFFAIFSGITLLTSRSYARGVELNITQARQARRLLLIFCLATIFPTGVSVLFFTAAASRYAEFTPSILGYLGLLWVPFLVSLVSSIRGRRLLRPADGLLRRYGTPQ